MLSFFLKIMKQKCGSYVCVQLLQTLNILFENIRNETSLCKSKQKSIHISSLEPAHVTQSLIFVASCRLPVVKQPRKLYNCSQI